MKNKLVIKPDTDLITRGDAKNAIRKACVLRHLPMSSKTLEGQRTLEALQAVSQVAAADAEPKIYAKWAHIGGDEWCCSNCGEVTTTEGSWEKPVYKRCYECGAHMKGEDKQDESNT